MFIEDYSATEDVFNRALPFLGLVFVVEVLGAANFEWSPAANAAAIGAALLILLGAFAGANRMRGRPAIALPQRIGRFELAGFVLIPALLPLVFGDQWRSALATIGANALLLWLVYLFVGYGVLSILRWAAARLITQLAHSLELLARALPMLMIFALLIFFTTEIWQVFSTRPTRFLVAMTLLFAILDALFVMARIPREVSILEKDAGAGTAPLTRRQRLNVGLVLFISQALQVVLVAASVGLFFVAFGALAVSPELQAEWIGATPDTFVQFTLAQMPIAITPELLRVAGAIAAFSGLYYAIAVLTDSAYRGEFLDEITDQMRETFRARARYLELLSGPSTGSSAGQAGA